MALLYRCPECGTIWELDENHTKVVRMIRNMATLHPDAPSFNSFDGGRDCNGCGRKCRWEEIYNDAYRHGE